ncbi:diuretic hormone receptor-like, partial [Drosophila miranda]|uniref:diuretic hormone receptor-like n=1 Tax=Drosophila miranda TaxID=7229 RepID=UPI00143F1DC5
RHTLLVLIPLFGITYLLVLTGPEQGISRNLFEAIRAFLISIQGFFVALFYCFLNSEVRQTLRHRFIRWRESRNIHRSSSIKNRSTEECVICLRPTPHTRLATQEQYHSINITDFV